LKGQINSILKRKSNISKSIHHFKHQFWFKLATNVNMVMAMEKF